MCWDLRCTCPNYLFCVLINLLGYLLIKITPRGLLNYIPDMCITDHSTKVVHTFSYDDYLYLEGLITQKDLLFNSSIRSDAVLILK